MVASAHALLGAIVDYAGTFPPASLAMADALAEYARARASADCWLLGRLVISGDALSDFERLAAPFFERDARLPWELSVIVSGNDSRQFERVRSFNEQGNGQARIAALEFGPASTSQLAELAQSVPPGVEPFFETPLHDDLDERLRAIKAAGGAAKIRTGGVTAGVFPTSAAIVHFLHHASDAGISFKATAGLHHALRGCYPLTYEAGSNTETMHGFLNLAVAAAIVRTGGVPQRAVEAMQESAMDAFRFRADGLSWGDHAIATRDLADTRRHFFRSFGSCSFREPADELRRLHVL